MEDVIRTLMEALGYKESEYEIVKVGDYGYAPKKKEQPLPDPDPFDALDYGPCGGDDIFPEEDDFGMEYIPVPHIEKVAFHEKNNETVIYWEDGTKTKARMGQGETPDRYTGFMAAVVKRVFGSTSQAKKLMKRLDEETLLAEEKRIADAEREAQELASRRKWQRRVKRRAREIAFEREAQEMAEQMRKGKV